MENQILDDGLIREQPKLIAADKGKRLGNYIIDRIVLTILTVGLTFGYYMFADAAVEEVNTIADYIISSLLFVVGYSFFEIALKGKTPGKYLTKTRVVMRGTGATPDAGTIIKRSFCRIVPFEAFSFLGHVRDGWHDKWSDTMVIDEELSVRPESGGSLLERY